MSSPAGKCPTSSTKKSSAFDILDEDDDEATITRLNSSVLCGMNLGNRGSKSSSADMFDDSVDEQLLGNVAEAAEQESGENSRMS